MPKVKLSQNEIGILRYWVQIEMEMDETDDEYYEELKDLDRRLAEKEN